MGHTMDISWSPIFIMTNHVHFIGGHGQNMVIFDIAMVINAGIFYHRNMPLTIISE